MNNTFTYNLHPFLYEAVILDEDAEKPNDEETINFITNKWPTEDEILKRYEIDHPTTNTQLLKITRKDIVYPINN
ncbi:MAG: hypothetical protein Q7K33_03920 [Candidatus Berkelbacteria bacterium]|nr:hypothetical protein [Candidatus Berkelbacteria bacterium]